MTSMETVVKKVKDYKRRIHKPELTILMKTKRKEDKKSQMSYDKGEFQGDGLAKKQKIVQEGNEPQKSFKTDVYFWRGENGHLNK